jgi:hypothetical protein
MSSVTKIFSAGATSGSPVWSFPGHITAEDGSYASSYIPGKSYSGTLIASTPGFTTSDIPDGSTILGISLRIKAKSSLNSYDSLSTVGLSKDGGSTVAGTPKVQALHTLNMALTDYTFGGPLDTWGTSWSPAEARSIAAMILGYNDYQVQATIYIDVVEVTVYFSHSVDLGSVILHGESSILATLNESFGMHIKLKGISKISSQLKNSCSLGATVLHGISFITIRTFISNMLGAGMADPLALLSFSPDMPGVIVYKHSTLPLESVLTHLYSAGIHSFQLNGGSRTIVLGSGAYFITDRSGNWLYAYINLNKTTTSSGTSELAIATQSYDINREFSLGDAPMSSLVFEEIARDVYGDAELGVLLRQLNIIDGAIGEQYIIPDSVDISKEELVPQSHIFQNVDKFIKDVTDKEEQDG